MAGWITYSSDQDSSRRIPVIFIPALHSRWLLQASDLRENQKSVLERNTSLGFYCGLLAGQTAADYPSLTSDLPEYFMDPYEAFFLPTQSVYDGSIHLSVPGSAEPGSCILRDISSSVSLTVRGSLPVMPPFVMARECRYFGFSPYLLKQQ